jgi:RNA polymerase sigma-70 factor (ECF subfamily)
MFDFLQSDQGIIRKVLRGHTDSFSALVDRYGHVVYGVAYARMGNAVDAEEVTQEVFVRLYQWLDRVVARKTVGPWLVEVARNVAMDLLRRRQREISLDSSDGLRAAAPDYAREEMRRLVWEQLANLDEGHREVIILHYFQNTKIREIARLLDISSQTAAKRLQRARDELGRRMLTAVGHEDIPQARDRGRPSRIMAAIAVAPVAWKPSVALSVAGAAITGASAVKLTAAITAVAVMAGLCIFGGWRYLRRPYPTQEITAASTFDVEKMQAKTQGEAASQAAPGSDGESEPKPEPSAAVRVEPEGVVFYGVVRQENGQPVPGATVGLDSEKTGTEPIHLSAITDRNGWFELPRVFFPKNGYRGIDLWAEAGGLYGTKRVNSLTLMRRYYAELIVEPCVSVTGQVVDARGIGIADATVQATLLRSRDISSTDTKTAPNGTFSLSHLVLTTYYFAIGAQGFVPLREERPILGKQRLVFRLEQGNWIGGRVVRAADGTPLGSVMVEARNSTYPRMGSGKVNLLYGSGETDERGEFKISGLESGIYVLQLGKETEDFPYVVEKLVTVDLPEDRPVTGIELRAVEGVTVSGHVLDSDTEEPIPDASVSLARAEWKQMPATTVADSTGHYTSARLSTGEYLVTVKAPDESVLETTLAISSLTAMEGVDFRVKRHPVIRGKVTDASNTPVAGASVVAVPLQEFHSVRTTDSAGEFAVPLPAQKRAAYLQAFTDNGVSPRLGPVRAGSYTVLKLLDAGAIEGNVVDTSGRPIAECYVVAVPDDSDMLTMVVASDGYVWLPGDKIDGPQTKTSSTGYFEMNPILPGKYQLQIYLRCCIVGYPAATARAQVQAGRTLRTQLVVDASGYGTIQGTVTVNDSPASYARVWAKPASESEEWYAGGISTYTDADGRYVIENVRPGTAIIVASARTQADGGSVDRSQTVEVVAGETKTADFHFGQQLSGVEGVVVTDGAALNFAFVEIVVAPAEASAAHNSVSASTDFRGYYRITDLQEGQYVARVMDLMHRTAYAEMPFEVKRNELARCDFNLRSGTITGVVLGLREGERAVVAVFDQSVDLASVTALAPELLQHVVMSAEVGPGAPFNFAIQPGMHYMGVVAIPANEETNETTVYNSVARGRYELLQLEVAPGQATAADVALP